MSLKRTPFLCSLMMTWPIFMATQSGCRESASEFGSVEGFEGLRDTILAYSSPDFEVLEVIDEGRVLRVDAFAVKIPADRLQTRVQASNALYALQSLVGTQTSLSVWLYKSRRKDSSNLLGMVFYHALTEQLVFKSSEELVASEEDTS